MRGFLPLVCLLALVGSCGSSDKPPGPLPNHFQDMYIAALPLDQKQAIVSAQQNWNVSQMETANADAQVKEAESQVHQARNDQKAAALAVDSANSNKKSADASKDMNRINPAAKELETAKNVQKAADARTHYVETYLAYLHRYQRYAQENMYYREAEYENAKAKLAQSNNIAPKDVNFASYQKQLDDRRSRTDGAKSKAESAKSSLNSPRESWLHAQENADKANGHAGVYWDPMAPKSGPSTL